MVDSQEVRRKAMAMRITGAIFVLLLAITMALTLGVILRQGQKLDAATTLIAECTTPPSSRVPPNDNPSDDDCWVRSRRQTGTVVNDISAVSIAAAACGAKYPGNIAATRVCVEEALAKQK